MAFALQAFAPATFNGDPAQLGTVFLGYIPKDSVTTLQSQLLTKNSELYKGSTGVPKQIAQFIDGTFPVTAVNLDTPVVGTTTGSGSTSNGSGSNGSSDSGNSSESRRDAIIGVCAAFGAVLCGVVGWWAWQSWKRKQDAANRRLTYQSTGAGDMSQLGGGYGATTQGAYGATAVGGGAGMASYGQTLSPFDDNMAAPRRASRDPFMDGQGSLNGSEESDDWDSRRRSYFYAEDSLRGYSAPREEEEGITFTQVMREQQGKTGPPPVRRVPIQANTISAPILRESSLNW